MGRLQKLDGWSLAAEPCVIERDQDVAQMLEDPRKLRKGIALR